MMRELPLGPTPNDPGIATLPAVLDPAELSRYLQGALPTEWGTLREVRVQVLAHHPGSRCTVEIAVRMTGGSYDLIGKVYAEDRSDV